MLSNRHLVTNEDVARIIGAKILDSWRRGPYPDQYRCPICSKLELLDDGVPTSISVVVGMGNVTAVLKHAECGPSIVIESKRPDNFFPLPERHLCVVRAEPSPRAIFVSVLEAQVVRVFETSAESLSLPLSAALADGFELVTGDPFSVIPPLISGWSLDVDVASGRLALVPRVEAMTPTLGDLPPGAERWIEVLREEHRCVILFGVSLRLDRVQLLGQLDVLAESANLVAGIVQVRWTAA
jgi:hypothetical protein